MNPNEDYWYGAFEDKCREVEKLKEENARLHELIRSLQLTADEHEQYIYLSEEK